MGVSQAQEHHDPDDEHAASSDAFHLATYRTWLFRSFMPDSSNDADTLGLEFLSTWGWGNYDVTNIAYIEVADYETGIPGLPPGNPEPTPVGDTGINDLLTAFLFSKKGGHHGPHHFSWGFAAQLPTGSGDALSSGKWSVGPAIDYEYQDGRFYAAFVVLQLWSVAGDSDRKDVNRTKGAGGDFVTYSPDFARGVRAADAIASHKHLLPEKLGCPESRGCSSLVGSIMWSCAAITEGKSFLKMVTGKHGSLCYTKDWIDTGTVFTLIAG